MLFDCARQNADMVYIAVNAMREEQRAGKLNFNSVEARAIHNLLIECRYGVVLIECWNTKDIPALSKRLVEYTGLEPQDIVIVTNAKFKKIDWVYRCRYSRTSIDELKGEVYV